MSKAKTSPNIQNIPVRSEEGYAIRRCFAPAGLGEQTKFSSADYSKIEARLLARFSDNPRLVEALRSGKDIHAAVAAELYEVPLDEVTEGQRRRAKTVNFGLMYGKIIDGESVGGAMSGVEGELDTPDSGRAALPVRSPPDAADTPLREEDVT